MAKNTELAALLGLPLHEARRHPALGGQPVVLKKTAPARSRIFQNWPPDEQWRVVRLAERGDGVEIVLAPALALPEQGP